MIFKAISFDFSSSIFCNAQLSKNILQDRQKPFSEFQQTAAVETCDKFRYKSFLEPCLYSTWFIEFVQTRAVACSFWIARVIENTRRKPFEFNWPEVRFNGNQTSMTPVPYNELLTNLAGSSRTGEYWPLDLADLGPIFPSTALALG